MSQITTLCNKANRANPEVKSEIESRTENLPLQHDLNARGRSVINNRGFAQVGQIMVEVVRRGPKSTRVRRSYSTNSATYLVKTEDILAYTHVDGRK